MTEKQFKDKMTELILQDIGLLGNIMKESLRLFHSGGVDTEKYEDNFELPKLILSATLKNESDQYFPLSSEGKKVIKNLSHF